jgi:hypothetical protein
MANLKSEKSCKTCSKLFAPPHPASLHCPKCRVDRQTSPAETPAVYRFSAPDGRAYIGSTRHSQVRGDKFARSNNRIAAALKIYPIKMWTYEVLERLEPGCSKLKMRVAEQQHIDLLKTWMPEYGFNISPAVLEMASSEQRLQFSMDCKRESRPPETRADIPLPNGRVLMPRAKFARYYLNVHDKTASRMNLPTTYIGGVAYVDRDASLEMIGDGVRSRKQPIKHKKNA